MRPLLFRRVPAGRTASTKAVLATCTVVVGPPGEVDDDIAVWELVDPGCECDEFAAAVAVTAHDDVMGEARIVAVVVADPDVRSTARAIVHALAAELRRDGIELVMPTADEWRGESS